MGNYYLVESKLKGDMLSLIASSFLFESIPFSDLVMKLLILFDSVHQKGIIINDVSSNNIFVDFTDDVYVSLCDFGSSYNIVDSNSEEVLSIKSKRCRNDYDIL